MFRWEPPRPAPQSGYIASYTGSTTFSYTANYTGMYYFACGPAQLALITGYTAGITGLTSILHPKWVYYKIDLESDTFTFNSKSIYFYRKDKCSKYEPWQLFWLNPHGGFDRHTFYKKNYTEYDIERTNWTHRYSDTYTLGERGLSTMNVKSKEVITLNSDWLAASETQLLTQLVHSPEIYALYKFVGNCYKIPYVAVDTNFEWKNIKNEKMVQMQIKIQPAHTRITQRN